MILMILNTMVNTSGKGMSFIFPKKTGILPDIQKHGIGQYFWSELVQ